MIKTNEITAETLREYARKLYTDIPSAELTEQLHILLIWAAGRIDSNERAMDELEVSAGKAWKLSALVKDAEMTGEFAALQARVKAARKFIENVNNEYKTH